MTSFLLAGRLALCCFIVGAHSSSVPAPDLTVPMLRREKPDGEFAVVVDASGVISNDPGRTGVHDGNRRNFADADAATLAQESSVDDDDEDYYYYTDGSTTGSADCTDTSPWNNFHGHGCSSYAQGWCAGNAAKPGQEWTLGATYNFPESNCCVCGKGVKGRPTPPPTPPPGSRTEGNTGGAGKCPAWKPWLEGSMCVKAGGGWGYHCPWEGAALCSAKAFGGCHGACNFDCVSSNVEHIIKVFTACSTAGSPNCHVSTDVAKNTVCCWKNQCQNSGVECGAGVR